MEANPYVMLVDALAGGAPADALVLGKVLSPEPLRVLAEGNTLGPGTAAAERRAEKGLMRYRLKSGTPRGT